LRFAPKRVPETRRICNNYQAARNLAWQRKERLRTAGLLLEKRDMQTCKLLAGACEKLFAGSLMVALFQGDLTAYLVAAVSLALAVCLTRLSSD
jgi:hypothetical protein